MLSRPRRLTAVLVLCLALGAAAGPPSAEAAQACAEADSRAGQASLAKLGRATVCLVNRERSLRGLPRLRIERRLSRAAGAHGRDMVRRRYFAHHSLSGAPFTARLRRAGYLRGRWRAGENLAWGSKGRSTPRAIVRAWMDSPGHRRNILNGVFRDIGVAAVPGAPTLSPGVAATYVHEFGRIR